MDPFPCQVHGVARELVIVSTPMRSPFQTLLCSATLIGFALTCGLQGQTLGTFTGEVRDTSGAAIAGAEITVRNTATNGIRNATTNEEGIYSIPALVPGMYDVKAEKTGFKTATRAAVELQVQQTARIDFGMEVGQVSETIEVTSAAAAAHDGERDSRNGHRAKAHYGSSAERAQFPKPGCSESECDVRFRSGGAGGRTARRHTLDDHHVARGRRSAWSNYTLDGITNTDINFNLYIVLPSVEALQEFKVQTGIYPAEFGRTAGQVNVSTRGGTNDYHGSAFEFLRNDQLDARPYFFKDPESPTQTAPLKPPYRQNQYGFTLGGPVRIPKLFNGKNRLFFMTNYEGFKSRTTTTQFFTTMTPAMRAGDFSAVPTPLQDPATRVRTPNPGAQDSQ